MIFRLLSRWRTFVVDRVDFDCDDNGMHCVITQHGHWEWKGRASP